MPKHPDEDDPKHAEPLPILYDEDEDDGEPEAEFDEEQIGDEPRTILITGACGNIGRKLRAAWEDVYDLVLIDIAAGPDDPDVTVGRPLRVRRGVDDPVPRRRHGGPPGRDAQPSIDLGGAGRAQHGCR